MVLWTVTLCCLACGYQRFWRKYRVRLQSKDGASVTTQKTVIGVVASAVFGPWLWWQSPACGPPKGGTRQLSLAPPCPLHPCIPISSSKLLVSDSLRGCNSHISEAKNVCAGYNSKLCVTQLRRAEGFEKDELESCARKVSWPISGATKAPSVIPRLFTNFLWFISCHEVLFMSVFS
jgi:hypothetical protein